MIELTVCLFAYVICSLVKIYIFLIYTVYLILPLFIFYYIYPSIIVSVFFVGSVTPLAILNGHEKSVTCVAVSTSHGLVVSGAKSKAAIINYFNFIYLMDKYLLSTLFLLRWLLSPTQYYRRAVT